VIDINSETFSLIIIPILIFIARVADVSFGTIRIILVSRGRKHIAPIFAFFEIIIWLFAISQIMQHLTNITYYLAYACGYATGNFIGVWVEEKMAIGMAVIRIITNKDASELVKRLRSTGYGVTSFDGQGATGPVKLIYMTIERKDIDNIVEIIKEFNPKAFFSIEEVRMENAGVFPLRKRHHLDFDLRLHRHNK
jgi:uncharacterized protein YebE (UPF0316 family)